MLRSKTVLLCSRKSRKGGRAFPSHANTLSEQGVAEDRERTSVGMVGGLGWRVCIANGLAKLRRSPRANGGKARQETVNGPKGMGGEGLVA